MKARFSYLCLLLVTALFSISAFPEGTKQIMPFDTAKGVLCIDKSRNDFAFYDAAPEFRLNIAIKDTSEEIRFGFGKLVDSTMLNMEYRVKDPFGNIIHGSYPVPVTGSGFINAYQEAVAGPFPLSGGYNYLLVKPQAKGDYYIEFYYPPDTGGYAERNFHTFLYFDITVVNNMGIAVNGRVWSKAWQFYCELPNPPPTSNRFYGKMMILSDDSIVTELNCNGFVGGTFSVSSNSTGCANTGDVNYDRCSRQGFHTYPQYKVFLNDPDSTVFPTQRLVSGIILPLSVNTNCSDGSADFGIKVVKDGSVEVLVELNPSPGADPQDVRIIANVKANPGGSGFNIVHWNGNDNLGKRVSNGTSLLLTVTYVSGLTHLPIYDIEYNDTGYIVRQIRPKGSQLRIYWDDSNILNGTSNTSVGCVDPVGCHIWDNDIGNLNTINSWWYVTRASIPSIPFVLKRAPLQPDAITGPADICRDSVSNTYSIPPDPNSESYLWSFSGTGVTITGSGPSVSLHSLPDATPGTLSVYGYNNACGNGPATTMNINFDSIPLVSVAPVHAVCYNDPEFTLSGGLPPGGYYTVDDTTTSVFTPYHESIGPHTLIYTYTSLYGCSSSDTTEILVRTGSDCDVTFFLPSAFTPDGDGLNDLFKPVGNNMTKFTLQIYNRSGQMIFSTRDFNSGWDGTYQGQPCPADTYAYIATYEVSWITGKTRQIKGTVTLLR